MQFTIRIKPDSTHEVTETVPFKPGERVEVRITPDRDDQAPKTLTEAIRCLFGSRGSDA